jgi:hypothetical protein
LRHRRGVWTCWLVVERSSRSHSTRQAAENAVHSLRPALNDYHEAGRAAAQLRIIPCRTDCRWSGSRGGSRETWPPCRR